MQLYGRLTGTGVSLQQHSLAYALLWKPIYALA